MSRTNPIVYVPQMVKGRNVSMALRFGAIVPILHEDPELYALDRAIKKLKEGLANYTAHDHLLLMGDPVVIGIATMIAGQNTGGYVNLLKFDRQMFDYLGVIVDLREPVRREEN